MPIIYDLSSNFWAYDRKVESFVVEIPYKDGPASNTIKRLTLRWKYQ